jgi:bacterioferritin-associated ferredoxin
MYVCICNGLNDRRIRAAAAESGGSAAEVYKALGCRPQCGRCVPLVGDIARESASPASPEIRPTLS